MPSQAPPVILGSSLSGLLVSLSLSRAGVEHVLIGGDEPPAIPRLGESVNDTASPELWRLYGRELGDCFHYKNHISYFNGNFSTLIHLASPRRSRQRVEKFAPSTGGTPRYPWFGEGLFHLDRIAFDRAIYHKALAQPQCRFVAARVTRLEVDAATDAVARIELDGGAPIERPRYVFDTTGYKSLVAEAAQVGQTVLGTPQRVVFTHYLREHADVCPPEWWRNGTNLLRLEREFDGLDAIAWLIPIGRTLSVGMSLDANGQHGDEDQGVLMEKLATAFRRRGLEYRTLYPDQLPIQQLRHSYFVRDRAWGANWLLVGGSFITIWFPSSAGLWTTTAAAGMAPRLLDKPSLGAFYDRAMRGGLLPFHQLLERVAHGPVWKSSLQVYRFYSRGMTFITGRVAAYLRIKNNDYRGLRPANWILAFLSFIGWLLPPLFLLIGGFALVRCRLEPDRRQQARPFPLYFHSVPFRVWSFIRSLPHLLWSAIPRRSLPG